MPKSGSASNAAGDGDICRWSISYIIGVPPVRRVSGRRTSSWPLAVPGVEGGIADAGENLMGQFHAGKRRVAVEARIVAERDAAGDF
ncbi:MAG TPA: hypothetical protein VMB03_22155 [Bryobacteraceae bacterium]|nr:hypothetical protein [Bryobacteraceae bacterium]